MKVESLALGEQIVNCVATIGSFDGVHQGHRCLLEQVRHIADEQDLSAIAITFGTSPKKVLGMADVSHLNTVNERTALLYQSKMDEVVLLDFTPQMAAMSARDFMQKVLKEQLHVAILVIGYDHRFGRGRSEGFDDYVRYGQKIGIKVVKGEACMNGDTPVSSTRIRHLLNDGKVEEATQLLGYRYALQGEVVGGYQEGRKMGFPTANIRPLCCDKLIPADGVYAVYVNIVDSEKGTSEQDSSSSSPLLGMLNIGYRPTLNNGQERSIEVHILDYEGMLYGKTITVEFAYRLRDEHTFANPEELIQQLQKDKEKVRQLLIKY